MRTALAEAPMRFPSQFDAAPSREVRESFTAGGPVHYHGPSRERGVSIEMNAKTAPENADPSIEFRNVTYSLNGSPPRAIVSNVSFSVPLANTLVLLGRSGSGKTTLLKLVNRLLLPSDGQVVVRGRSTSDWHPIRLRRGIGYVIQEAGLFPHFTVAENIALVPSLEKWDSSRTASRVDELLTLVGLQPAEYRDRRLGKTIVFVTHDLREALLLASRIILLEKGRIVASATPQEFPRIDHPEVRAFTASLTPLAGAPA